MCTPLGICTNCNVGSCKFRLSEINEKNKEKDEKEFEKEFVILPKSAENPILGIRTIRDCDLVGEYPGLFRTEAAMANQPPPITSAGDEVTSRKKPVGGTRKRKKSLPKPSAWNNVKGPQGVIMGVREAMESRRILKIGGRRIGGKWIPADAGLRGKKIGVRKRKVRELALRRLATLLENLPRDDGNGRAVPTSTESDLEAVAIPDGTLMVVVVE